MKLSEKGVIEKENATVFTGVKEITCKDRKRFQECSISQEVDGKNLEGSIKASDLVINSSNVESFSTNADTVKSSFEDGKCKLYDENNILTCSSKNT